MLATIGRWAWLFCAVTLLPATAAASQAAADAQYDFGYRLSGDRRVAPVQVFDDGGTTWLQFPPGQVLPALFAADSTPSGELRLAPYTQQGPYLVLNGTATTLVMRVGSITARADYIGKAARTGVRSSEAPQPSQWAHETLPPALAGGVRAGASTPPVRPAAAAVAHVAAAAPVPAIEAGSVQAAPLEFDAALSDRNMRRVLDRWARQAGWRFGPEHWAVDVDIPLIAAASFGADFRNAVRGLLAATELADRPLQPCFYSNRVLRVVPLAQACDRTTSPLAPAVPAS